MMGQWVVFREIVCQVGSPRSLVDPELSLGLAIVEPVETHIHCLGAFWLDLLFIMPSAVVLSVWIGVRGCGCPISGI